MSQESRGVQASPRIGVRLAGTGAAIPSRTLTNADLEKLMETTDEWIVQRTGIRNRHILDIQGGETISALGASALRRALESAHMTADDLDVVICATMTPDMPCPPTACLIVDRLGTKRPAGFDLNAACSGFVFGLNLAHDMIRGGSHRNIALIGADALSSLMRYSNEGRGTAILFGDAAGAVILRATDDTTKGVVAQSMHTDGSGWKDIYVPRCAHHCPPGVRLTEDHYNHVQMNGAGVFKFAVGTFPGLIAETLEKAGLVAKDVDMYVCHQSNARILTAARERFGLPEDKLYVNIDRFGNTVAASVPLCLDELVRAGRVQPGMRVMFLGFGGGLTWGSSLWQL